ncbi:tyrosine-type recombinase/integrase [Mycobacterium marseillense]|uniref:tyrosine-type recombinase/integrase n=1 Tax=Mycobacterium marseillense TaxID=701042 RepID=UPI0009F60BB0|nr:tyrosine-type recombinase/integrase [Mycobacterium marseillense]MCA2261978.1 tyrosine-type recombinase/integrase [Mycobacterium marseillense]
MDETLLAALLPSWKLAMDGNRSDGTIKAYLYAVTTYVEWCEANDRPTVLDKDTVRAWIADMLGSGIADATARLRQQALKSYAKWLHSEGEIDSNPIESVAPPKLAVKVTEALTDEQVAALIKACKGNTLADRRDEALVRFMAETGTRAAETIAVQLADVDLSARTAIIRKGKGGKGRMVPLSPQCAQAIDRYLRLRRRLNTPADGPLWIGVGGKTFGYYGLDKTLKQRAEKAGIKGFHLHLMRHTAATRWLRQGGSEGGLMAVAGWSSRAMLDRYTRASASGRALAEAERLSLGSF